MDTQQPSLRKSFSRSPLLSSTLLGKVHQAFLQGLALCATKPAAPRTPPWAKELEESYRLSPEQQTLVKHCVFYLGKARDSAAQGDVTASIQLFAMARTYRDDSRLMDEARQLCNSSLEAAEAYLDYVSGDLGVARQRIVASMTADQTLEENYEYAHLHVHRVHLANNLVKLEACAGRLESALSLAAELLSYVAGQVESVHAPTAWGPAWTSALSDQARRYLAIQTTREIGCATAGHCDPRTLSAWQHSIAPLMREPSPILFESHLLEWYELKQSYLACSSHIRVRTESYLDNAATYLAKGPGDDVLCWQLVALDVLLACSTPIRVEALELCQEITKALSQSRSLPRHLRTLLRRSGPATPAMRPSSYDQLAHGAREIPSNGD